MCRPGWPPPTGELVALYDDHGRPAGETTRERMRALNLTHAATAVVVRDAHGRVHVHRRTDSKDVFPGRHDFAAGGVVDAGEDPADAAVRELEEELGVSGVVLRPVRVARYRDEDTDYWGHCFTTTWEGPVRLQPEEIAWGEWWPVDRLVAALEEHPGDWVPDTAALLGDWLRERAAARRDVDPQGWDSHAEVVEERWLDRTPRRPGVALRLEVEARLMPRLAPRLPLQVPVPVALATDPARFRHRRVPGDPADGGSLDADDGRDVGRFLRALHDTPAEVWDGTGISDDAERLPDLDRMADRVLPLLPVDLRAAGRALLDDCRDATRLRVLRHGDLGPDHLLVTGGRVTGVIDWADVALGDPALDLAWLVHGTPAPFRDALVATYGATRAELARGHAWHRLGPWWEVLHGLDGGGEEYVASGLDGAVERLRRLP